jgi:aspartyl protease family protein
VTNDVMLGSLYLLMAMMLVLGALINRREPAARMVVMALAWVAIFGGGFVLFTFRDDLGFIAQRLRTEATGEPIIAGSEVRIPMAIDGHFWVDGQINGVPIKFLVDSGATVTTIDRASALRAGAQVSDVRNQVVRTGNGFINVARGRAQTLQVAAIERRDIRLHIVDGDDMNVLGMNFLSTLTRWSVEGRWLILQA